MNPENSAMYDPMGQVVSSVGSDGVDDSDNSGELDDVNRDKGQANASRDSLITELDTESVYEELNPQTSFPGSASASEIEAADSLGPADGVFTGLNGEDGLM